MIRKAHLDDLPRVMLIVNQTIINMKTWGNKQWDENYPNNNSFKIDIANNNLYVYEDNKQVIAFITIDKQDPEDYFGLKWRSDNEHFVFHRFAVHTNFKGRGIASELLSYGQAIALESKVHYLRIDTNSTNIPMNSLLSKFGFKEVDRVKFRNITDEFICYDKLLSEVQG